MFLDLNLQAYERIAAIDDAGNSITFGALNGYYEKWRDKIEKRSIVFILCRNCIGALAGYIACMNLKAIPLLLNAGIDGELLQSLTETYTPRYFWIPDEMTGKYLSWKKLAESDGYSLLATGYELYPVYDGLSMLLTTSGSTGSPKLVRHSFENPEVNARNVASFFGFTPKDRGMCDLPMQYTMGLNVILSHLVAGAKALLAASNLMSPEFWRFFKEERATDFTGVPFSYDVLMRLRFMKMDLPDLRIIAEGGGKLTDARFIELAEYAERTGRKFFATFGTTETTARLAFLPPEMAIRKIGSMGRAIPGGELFLLDDDGNVINELVAEGEMGYRGPNVTLGYAICKDDLTKGDERHGEYRTGDIARRDEDGCYYIVGRKSRFLKLYGLRISLDQCERLISAKFGLENACTGDDSCMRVYINDATACGEVKNYISEKIGVYNAAIKVLPIESIPRNESGKIRYKELR